ncbi:MAG: beta-glucosidase BglX [Prevotella sp.]|jgi:beta-glucosidase|nr:beta-glucosidase BglX [Prevotella sp.]MCI1474118.1 beta-glucosidase BglX [Prevotella sp.]MCI1518256.1 beta-glucosidase BglX [Prevotella sp.]MCI1549266.1 beta-glucosidase BglX [Prevotella sp.]MCI1597004.1 beta-glucosidase BglX [Prevotella sp.]
MMKAGTKARKIAITTQRKEESMQKMNRFVSQLMSKMTLDEKIGQLNLSGAGNLTPDQVKNSDVAKSVSTGQVGAILSLRGLEVIRELQNVAVKKTRLGIPLLFGLDVIHGYETTFPIPLALSCSWDMDGIKNVARISAEEASCEGICWTFSPMVDICHDARWGRIAEGAGEDPYLGSAIAKAMVRGYQEDLSSNSDIMACIKHFALYGAAEAGRDYNTVDMSKYRMYNEYFPPYKAAVEAGAGSVMTSFNTVNGVPSTANKWLLTDVLRNQWHFNGFVVTDATAIAELRNHGLGDLQQVSAKSLTAGVDMDMGAGGFVGTLKKSLSEGKITETDIDNACRYILEAKYKLGLFTNPYKFCDAKRAKKEERTTDHLAEARKMASESFVLLKNENHLLPLRRGGTVAVVGPLAEAQNNMNGTWSVNSNSECSLVTGLKDVAGSKVRVLYAKGCNLEYDHAKQDRETMGSPLVWDNRSNAEMTDEAVKVANQADVVVAALGEAASMSGECASRSQIDVPECQENLLKALVKTGKPVVLVLFNGRPLILNWEKANVPAILDVWFGGSEAARAIGDVLFGDVNPSGKLTVSFPQNVGQLPYTYSHENTGRPLPKGQWFRKFCSDYLDVSNDMLYPFGYGLSYTTYTYSNFSLSADKMNRNDSIQASVTVTNTGNRDGYEIVQMYLHQAVGSVARPVKELKGFKRVLLKSGESKRLIFTITPDMLRYYNNDLQSVLESRKFDVMIGPNSEDLQSRSFMLE